MDLEYRTSSISIVYQCIMTIISLTNVSALCKKKVFVGNNISKIFIIRCLENDFEETMLI